MPGKETHAKCRAQVAHLEAKLASRKEVGDLGLQAVNRLHMEVDQLRVERDVAQAANAAMAAALQAALTYMKDAGLDGGSEWNSWHAALSPDAGKGWVSPEVREQVVGLLEQHGCVYATPCIQLYPNNKAHWCGVCATLDVLKEGSDGPIL